MGDSATFAALGTDVEKGIYQPTSLQLVENRRLVAWLVEAVLVASNSNYQALGVIS